VSAVAVVGSVSTGGEKKYDFGVLGSPLEAGYTAVYPQTSYSSSQGYGWRSGYLSGANQNNADALSRDMNYTVDGTFAVDLATGTYVVTLTMGDTTYHHDNMGIYLEGNQVDSVTPVVGQYTTKSYQVNVVDGQLTLRLKDLGGSDPNAIINGLTITSSTGSTDSAPTVQSLSASPSLVLPGDPITLTADGVSDPDGDLAKVRFYRDANGNGTLETSSDVLVGEDTNGSNGWTVSASTTGLSANSYTFLAVAEDQGGRTSAIVSAVAVVGSVSTGGEKKYDFGVLGSPLEAGYTAVHPQTNYSSSQGYGWLSGYLSGANQNNANALSRDMNYTVDGTFAVDLASGTYLVTVTMGDTTYHHDNMGIYLEGNLADTVTPVLGQYTTRSYQVTVLDGQLTLRLRDLGGSDANAIINGLSIEPIEGASESLSSAAVPGKGGLPMLSLISTGDRSADSAPPADNRRDLASADHTARDAALAELIPDAAERALAEVAPEIRDRIADKQEEPSDWIFSHWPDRLL
jgi:fibronectin type 3 domain-containing protein